MPRDLPNGVVTFLFTDIEGSTRLLDEVGEGPYAGLLAEHRRLLRACVTAHCGVEVDTQGDAFLFAFADAGAAVAAAAEGQSALAANRVRVRMGLHTGEVTVSDDGYVGRELHRAARIAAAGHGGQVLLSKHTYDLVEAAATDLGEHRVKDFAEPVWLYQLGAERFPPLRTISNTNVPRPASSFIGRKAELEAVVALVRGQRLVTLTGAGGSGKSRLAVEAAAEMVPEFNNGVFWVGLSSLTDPSLVLPTVAQTLGARGPLSEHIAAREILLVLDNLEHVVDTAPELAALVAVCPRLRLLVTSRERLRVDGESVYAVPQLASSDAAELFCARSGLEPNDTISELCRQLDHLPLAVELAAARASVMSPAQILERLSNRLDLLKGSRHSNSRQRTLRAAITWSFELLHPDEQELFVRLAVFAGGWNLDAAEAVLGADVDVLQSLVDKSLLDFGDERFRMLETIRQFAAEKFQRDESRDIARRAHVEFFLAFAEEAQEGLEGAQQTQWFARLSADQDNVRAALACSVELGLAEATIRLAAALWRFWYVRGAAQEGRRWYEIAFGAAPAVSPALRANAVYGWGCMDYAAGAYDAAQRRFEHALELYRETGNDDGVVRTLYELGSTHSEQGDVDRAENLYQQALALARATGNRRGEAVALGNLGYIALHRGDLARAAAMHQETLLLDRERGDDYAVAISLAHLAWIDIRLGRLDDAAARITDSLRLSRAIEDNLATASTFVLMSRLLLARGDASASARILGAGTAFSEAVGVGMESEIHRLRDETVQQARAELGDEAFGAAFDAGRSLTPEQAVALVANAESARA